MCGKTAGHLFGKQVDEQSLMASIATSDLATCKKLHGQVRLVPSLFHDKLRKYKTWISRSLEFYK